MMKRLLTILCIPAALLLLSSTEGWSLPPCKGSDKWTWTNCFGTYTYGHAGIYVGEWKNGKKHGQGALTYGDGSKFVGGWANDRFHGYGVYSSTDGSVWKGTWIYGQFLE